MALAFIVVFFVVIGILAAVGAMTLGGRLASPRLEQIAYGVLLLPIAAVYLAFLAYLSPTASWRTELMPVLGFAVLGLAGTRWAPLLMLGYFGHGIWDLVHEIRMHLGQLGDLTAIPVAYGVFCLTFDWMMVWYFRTRQSTWAAAWARKLEQ
jgi:hypothetical protein